ARTHGIAIDASCSNLAASPALDGFINAHDHWLISWNKQVDKQHQQQAAEFSTRPFGTIEHSVMVLELLLVRASHHSQDSGDRSLSWCQDRPDQKHFGPFP